MPKAVRFALAGILFAFILLFAGATTHFFTRHGVTGGHFLEEHWPWWADLGLVDFAVVVIDLIRGKSKMATDLLTGVNAPENRKFKSQN